MFIILFIMFVICAILLTASMFMSLLGHLRSRNAGHLIGSDTTRL